MICPFTWYNVASTNTYIHNHFMIYNEALANPSKVKKPAKQYWPTGVEFNSIKNRPAILSKLTIHTMWIYHKEHIYICCKLLKLVFNNLSAPHISILDSCKRGKTPNISRDKNKNNSIHETSLIYYNNLLIRIWLDRSSIVIFMHFS